MKAIARQFLFVVLALAGLYLSLLGITLVLFPATSQSGALDTASAASTLYMTEPKYVLLNREPLAAAKPRAVLVGASNVVVGFKPSQLSELVPGVEIDNFGVGGSNVTQVSQVVDLVQQMQGPDARRQTTFVIGIWYGLFAENRAKWFTAERHPGDTDIDIERYRYGFFRRTASGFATVLPPNDLSFGVLFIHPYLVLDKVSREATRRMRDLLHGRPPERTDLDRNATVLSESDKRDALEYWRAQMQSDGEIPPEQFDILRQLIGRILASGSKVVLVDLPIPHWHASRSPMYPSFERQKEGVVAEFVGRPGFTYIEMKRQDDDLEFSDEVHPKPRATIEWARALAQPLQAQSPTGSAGIAQTTP